MAALYLIYSAGNMNSQNIIFEAFTFKILQGFVGYFYDTELFFARPTIKMAYEESIHGSE